MYSRPLLPAGEELPAARVSKSLALLLGGVPCGGRYNGSDHYCKYCMLNLSRRGWPRQMREHGVLKACLHVCTCLLEWAGVVPVSVQGPRAQGTSCYYLCR